MFAGQSLSSGRIPAKLGEPVCISLYSFVRLLVFTLTLELESSGVQFQPKRLLTACVFSHIQAEKRSHKHDRKQDTPLSHLSYLLSRRPLGGNSIDP